MSTFQDKLILRPQYQNLIFGYIRRYELDLSTTFPVALIYRILLLYEVLPAKIVNEIHKSKIILISRLKMRHKYSFYFNQLNFKKKISIGMINCTEEKPKLHKYPSFSGLLLVKNGVCEYKYGTFNNKTETMIQSFDSLKISFVFSKKYIEILYVIKDNYFHNQFMYKSHHHAILSKKKEKIQACIRFDKKEPNDHIEYFCIQLFDFGDSFSLTNVTIETFQ